MYFQILIIVNVNPAGSAEINPGIYMPKYDSALDGVNYLENVNFTENDTIYYTRSVNGITLDKADQYAVYTFKPTVTNGTLDSVAIHTPIGSKNAWNDSDWTIITANEDSSYTVRLTDGRSVIRITAADGTAEYYVVKAYGLDITVDSEDAGVSLADGQFTVTAYKGNDVIISFKGLELPQGKLGALLIKSL
jgi:hypothetical protein